VPVIKSVRSWRRGQSKNQEEWENGAGENCAVEKPTLDRAMVVERSTLKYHFGLAREPVEVVREI
jgi:hypothetical protein